MKKEIQDPAISIILPVFNSENYLADTIESIINQSFKDFELIIINDGSKDSSGKICDNYAEKDKRIKVVHKENGGICDARNTGMRIASGEYLTFCDHDDIYLPDLLLEGYSLAKKNNADIIKYGRYTKYLKNNKEKKSTKTIFDNRYYSREDIRENYFTLRMIEMLDCVWDAMFRRELIISNSIEFNTLYKAGQEDIDFNSNVISYANSLVSASKTLFCHIIREGFSTSSKPNLNKLVAIKSHAIHLNVYLERLEINLEDHRYDYAIFFSKEIIGNLLHILRTFGNSITTKDKLQYIDEFRQETFVYEWMKELSFIKLGFIANKVKFKNIIYIVFFYLFLKEKYFFFKLAI
jgi:glycosyltransferase involved in cell wall biosynthesis